MKLLIPLLFFSSTLFAQSSCEDFLDLMGRREISEQVKQFRIACGPFDETISPDGNSKTLTSLEKGITLTFVNYESEKSSTPKYEVFTVELTSFSGKGGYKGELPFEFDMGMDYKLVKNHIKQLADVEYDRSDIGKRRSYFNYTGPINDLAKGKKIRVYISQYDGRTITTMRLRLK